MLRLALSLADRDGRAGSGAVRMGLLMALAVELRRGRDVDWLQRAVQSLIRDV